MMRMKMLFMVFLVLAVSLPLYASTVAYWRFDVGPVDTIVQKSTDAGRYYSGDIPDVSGNGNHMSPWTDAAGNSAFWYRGNTPFSFVPQTYQTDPISVQNYGNAPQMFTFSDEGEVTGIDAEVIEPAQFTVEAFFNPNASQDTRNAGKVGTMVCRDGYYVCSADSASSAFALRVHDADSDTAAWSIESMFVDVDGYKHEAQSGSNTVESGKWYHVAVVSDGTTFKVYLTNITDSGDTEVVASVDMTSSGSTDTALTTDTKAPYSTWIPGGWVLYRELIAKGHVNRYEGYLDEVRISDVALSPIDFLCNVGQNASNPTPVDDATGVGTSTGTYTVTVDLGWDAGLAVDPSDPNVITINPNILKYYLYMSDDQNASSDPALYLVDDDISPSGTTGSKTVTLDKDGLYLWRVDEGIDMGGGAPSGTADPNTITGYVWSFETKLSNFPPDVDAGDTIYTWLTGGTVDVQMAPTVTDDGVIGPCTFLWEESPEDPNLVINSPTAETTTVTIDKVGTYTLSLTANDGELEDSDTVAINVYADACLAAKAVPGYTPLVGDLDGDCDVDIADLSMLATGWLQTTALTAPLP